MALKGLTLTKAKQYLSDVLNRKRCVPFRRFTACVGRTAQAKEFGATQGRWPVKSCEFLMGLLKNAESNAEVRPLVGVMSGGGNGQRAGVGCRRCDAAGHAETGG